MDLPGSIILVLELQSHTSAPNLCVGLGNPTWVLMLALTESALHSPTPAQAVLLLSDGSFLFWIKSQHVDRDSDSFLSDPSRQETPSSVIVLLEGNWLSY